MSAQLCCRLCGVVVALPVVKTKNGHLYNMQAEEVRGWYFTTETGWLCPADAPKAERGMTLGDTGGGSPGIAENGGESR